jgi:hypothetical protein
MVWRAGHVGHHWWSLLELEGTDEEVPDGLARIVRALLDGSSPT